MAHFLVELGNKLPVAYFYTLVVLLMLYFSKNKDERILSLISATNGFYLVFSAITVLWFVPGFLGIISEVSSTPNMQSTKAHSQILFRMSFYLFITLLPTFLAISFVVQKCRRSLFWTGVIMFWTSPLASLMLRRIWWDVQCIWEPKWVEGQVFHLNFFKHVDQTLMYTMILGTILLLLVYRLKIVPEFKMEKEKEPFILV